MRWLEVTARDRVDDFVVFLLCEGVNFSLKVFRVCKGKVWPFSQISMSFLIFSCIKEISKWGFMMLY